VPAVFGCLSESDTMKIPAFIKKIIAFCDPGSIRYRLNSVKCESQGGMAHVVATDGRALTCVSFKDDGEEVDTLVDGAELKSLPARVLPSANLLPNGMVESDFGMHTIPVTEGRFPEYERVLVMEGEYTPVYLDPALLKKLCDVHAAKADEHYPLDGEGFVVWFSSDPQKPVFTSSRHGEYIIRSVLMPLACDDGRMHAWPDRPTASGEPAPVAPPVMKAVIGTKRTRKAKDKAATAVPSIDPFAGAV